MIKFIKYISILIITTFVVITMILFFAALTEGFKNRTPNIRSYTGQLSHSLLRFAEADTFGKCDILIAGSSKAYMGYNPAVFRQANLVAFNLGSSNQTPYNTFYLLKHYLPRFNPSVVIIDVFGESFSNRYLAEGTCDIMSNCTIDSDITEMAVKSLNLCVYQSFIVEIFKSLIFKNKNYLQKNYGSLEYQGAGFVANYHHELLKKNKPIKFAIDKRQVRYLEKCVDLCQSYGSRVVLVCSPQSAYYQIDKKSRALFVNALHYISKQRQIDFLDFSNQPMDEPVDFADNIHLSPAGTLKFNNRLLSFIKPRYSGY